MPAPSLAGRAQPTLFDERGLEDGGFLSRPFLDAYRSDAARLRRGPPDQAAARFVHFMDALFAAGRRFAALLGERGIRHRLLEHDGGHVDHLGVRIEREALPVFARTLCPTSG